MDEMKKRVLIIDDHPIFRMGLKELINQEDDLEVCGEVEKPAKVMDCIKTLSPNIVLIDLALEQTDDGLELISRIRASHEGLPLLVISMYDESRYAKKAIKSGANGYIMKQEASDSVIKAIKTILNGHIFISHTILSDILSDKAQSDAKSNAVADMLTERELEVFGLIGRGKTTNEIADILFLSPKTIGTYRERIKEKLNIRHSSELIKRAVAWRIEKKSD